MAKFIFYLFFVFLCTGCANRFALKPPPSSPPKPFTKHQEKVETRSHDCLHRNTYSLAQRLQFFPFNEAALIKIVSFEAIRIDSIGKKESYEMGLPIKNDTINYSKIHEQINLTPSQTDTLTDILYNLGFRRTIFRTTELACFNPRNAIVFFDEKGKLIAYIQICFECENYGASSAKINIGDICTQKYSLLKKFFISLGINYGTLNHTAEE